jgi:hypothetical protein
VSAARAGLTVGLTVALTLSLGCSGSKADPKAGFIKAAAAVCDGSADDIEAASAQLTPQSTEEQVSLFLKDRLVPLYRQRIDALRKLAPPAGDQATISAILDDQSKVVDSIERDPSTFTALTTDPFSAVDARWDAYGLTPCGSRAALPSSP